MNKQQQPNTSSKRLAMMHSQTHQRTEKQIPPAAVVTASCTVGHNWSPDSRLIAVSTTSPRMNVDNGASVCRCNGDKVTNLPWDNQNYRPDRLLQVTFLPAASSSSASSSCVCPDRLQSPSLKGGGNATNNGGGGAATAATAAPKLAAGRYVPPSARNRAAAAGRGGGTSLADRMRAEREGTMKGAQKLVAAQKQKSSVVVGASGKVAVGMSAPSNIGDQKSKSALRREKEKKKKTRRGSSKGTGRKIVGRSRSCCRCA